MMYTYIIHISFLCLPSGYIKNMSYIGLEFTAADGGIFEYYVLRGV